MDNLGVELEEAFAWTCPKCSKRNRAEWILLELDSETIEELRECGEELGESVYGARTPRSVHCPRCKTKWRVINVLCTMDDDDE